jgi:hypothetical protein
MEIMAGQFILKLLISHTFSELLSMACLGGDAATGDMYSE